MLFALYLNLTLSITLPPTRRFRSRRLHRSWRRRKLQRRRWRLIFTIFHHFIPLLPSIINNHTIDCFRLISIWALKLLKLITLYIVPYNSSLQVLLQASAEAEELIKASERHLQEKLQVQIEIQQHREMANTVESSTQDRIRKMYASRTKEEWLRTLSSSLEEKVCCSRI